mgnify:FL=1
MVIVGFTVLAAPLLNNNAARAEKLAPAVIAFIDYQQILRDAVAAKSIRQPHN